MPPKYKISSNQPYIAGDPKGYAEKRTSTKVQRENNGNCLKNKTVKVDKP